MKKFWESTKYWWERDRNTCIVMLTLIVFAWLFIIGSVVSVVAILWRAFT